MKITKSKLLLVTVLLMAAIFIAVVELIKVLVNGISRTTQLNFAHSYGALLVLILFVVQYFYFSNSEKYRPKSKNWLVRVMFFFVYIPAITCILAFIFTLPVMMLPNGFGIFISLALIYLACGVVDRMSR